MNLDPPTLLPRGPGLTASSTDFRVGADLALPALAQARSCGCQPSRGALACGFHGRRLFTGLAAASALGLAGCGGKDCATPGGSAAPDGVARDVGQPSIFVRAVPSEQVERAAAAQFRQMTREAQQRNQLAGPEHPQMQRLQAIAQRIIPLAGTWNSCARNWQWEVKLFGSQQVNAFCMPGGKIAFYWGILSRLQLTDDEVAMIMGHEVAHALREHARERMGKQSVTQVLANVVSYFLGLGQMGDMVLGMGAQLLSLKFSRDDETEADLIGLELAARAGYDPNAGVTLWQKMLQANRDAPPEFISTHPAGESRIQDIRKILPKVLPLYERAPRPPRVFGPPAPRRS